MATKRFVTYSKTKAEFIAAELQTTYNDSIVFIKGGEGGESCIYTHGTYFANFTDFLAAVNYVKGIKVGSTSYNAAQGGGYVAFSAKDPATVAVNAGSDGIEIGLTDAFIKKVDDVVALAATIKSDYLKASDRTALETLISAAQTKADSADGKVETLSANVGDVNSLDTTAETVVEAINEVVGLAGELAGDIADNKAAAAVTVSTKTNDNYAQSYEIKQGGTVVGTINIPKDMVVKSGEVVVNPSGQPTGTYIKLTLQNAVDPIYINVADLVDAYTAAASATQVKIAISDTNVISATLVDKGVATAHLADGAVTEGKIAANAVTNEKLSTALQASIANADSALEKANDALTQIEDLDATQVSLVDGGANFDGIGNVEEALAHLADMWDWQEL